MTNKPVVSTPELFGVAVACTVIIGAILLGVVVSPKEKPNKERNI